MSKIICELCGTSYSENAAQCPICGCAHPVDSKNMVNDVSQRSTESTYQYVKGGRFSKANVRKRNSDKQKAEKAKASPIKEVNQSEGKKSNKGLIITILVLLIAIIAVVAYIALTFFAPAFLLKDTVDETQPSVSTMPSQPAQVPCVEVTLDFTQITLEQLGDTAALNVTVLPDDTTDSCVFFTADDTVATVNAEGVITAVGSGETEITVTCGNIISVCTVTVAEPAEPFTLIHDQLTFMNEGDEALIYTGTLPTEEMIWASDDETVAVVNEGMVTAVGNGTTTIYGSYNGETLICTVICEFEEIEETTEETFVDNGPYRLKNKYGFSDSDATIRVGESFNLILIDKNGDAVTKGVKWSVVDGDCCTVTDGTVEGVSKGQAKVVATFNGESYSFLVRVS